MKVAVCTPCYSGEVSCAFTDSLISTITAGPRDVERVWAKHIGCPYLALARSIVTAQAMAWGADRLFFIDDDISWHAEEFWRVAQQATDDIVVGAYPMFTKQIDVRIPISQQVKACYRPLGTGATGETVEPIYGAGLGFACISRSVFEALKPGAKKFSRPAVGETVNAEMYDYFAPTDETDEWCGEDFGFCRRAREHGFDVMLDHSIRLIHHEGRMGLTGAYQ